MKRYIRAAVLNIEEKELRMLGDYQCSCGCGTPLGRPENGLDGKPADISYGVGLVTDEEGFDWRMFTKKHFEELLETMSLEDIYFNYPPCSEIQ